LQRGKGPLRCGFGASDQNVIPTVAPFGWQHTPCDFSQTSFGPVSGDSVADLFGAGKANANTVGLAIAPSAALDHHAFGALPAGAGSAQKV